MSAAPFVMFPDSVQLVLDQLDAELPAILGRAVPGGNRVPSPRPDEFIRVRRMGGTRVTIVSEEAYLEVEAWGATVADAEDIAQGARAVLFAMAGQTLAGIPIYQVNDAGGPAEVADPLSDQPRHTFSIAIHVRGQT